MPLHESTPGTGARKRFHWPHRGTANGETWQAYIAGRCHWYMCHKEGKYTKPCLSCVSGGELICSHDHDIDEPVERGYMPLVAKFDFHPCFVMVYPHLRDHIETIKWKHLVTVARGKGENDTVTLLPALGRFPPFTSTLAELNRPADLTESLLRIWKKPELTAWYRRSLTVTDNPVSLPESEKPKVRVHPSDGKPFSPTMQAAAARYNAPEGDEAAEKEYEEMKSKMRKLKEKLPPAGKEKSEE